MAKKDAQENDFVKLILVKDGKEILSDEEFKVIQILNKNAIKVEDQNGETLNVRKSRAKLSRRGQPPAASPQIEEKEMSTAEAQAQSQPKAETPPAAKTPTKKAKQPLESFDPKQWGREHGGVLYRKECDFKVKDYKLFAYVAIDAENGYYYFINAYHYPDGTVSAGKSKGQKYPLLGSKITRKRKDKGRETIKGRETAAQYAKGRAKKGYELILGTEPKDPEPQKKEPKKESKKKAKTKKKQVAKVS